MENTIDRTSYRRVRTSSPKVKKEKKSFLKNMSKTIIIQSMIGVFILAVIGMFKILNVEVATNWIKGELARNASVEEIYKFGVNKFKSSFNTKNYTVVWKEIDKNIINDADFQLDATSDLVENLEPIMYINTEEPAEPEYESAVEGINQLSTDAKFIKENYNIIYPMEIKGTVTSLFGVRCSSNPIIPTYHSGIDLAANIGTKIKSALKGEVIKVSDEGSYGKHIMIKTDDIVIVYAHCSKMIVKVGQKVNQGAIIGEVGNTGLSTGPHLHFEIRLEDRIVNPADIIEF